LRYRDRSITLRAIRYFWRQWRDELTPAGKIAVWSICVTGMGTVSVNMPIYQLFFALVMLLGVAATVGYFLRPHVAIIGDFPDHGTAGRPLTAMFTLKNLRRMPAYDIGLNFLGLSDAFATELDRELIERLGAGESAAIPVTITPLRRGRYQLPELRAYSTFPFYLGRSGKSAKAVSPLVVVPGFEPISALSMPIGSRYQPGGIALTSHVGESPEYVGNREYVPGEPIRRLDFRAWARTGRPVVREYQEEYYCRVALVLDTFIPPGRRQSGRGFDDLEAAISLTAAIAEFLSGGEHLIDLFAAGPELHVFRSGRHTAHFENVLEILSGVEACRDDPFAKLGPAVSDEMQRISTAVVILLTWSESRRELLERVTEAGCRLRTFLVVRDASQPGCDPSEIPECTVLDLDDLARGGLELR
jgi:uncharacterized protein (DUF58 family)